MFLLVVYLVCLLASAGVAGLAAWSDFKGMIIPNIYSVLIITFFALAYVILWLGGHDGVFGPLASHVSSAALVFVVTLGMYALNGIGGGDSKLATALALWISMKGLLAFVFYMSLAGGILGLITIFLRKWPVFKNPPEGGWVAQCQTGANKVPYGIAIFIGALASFANLGYFSREVFTSFLLN